MTKAEMIKLYKEKSGAASNAAAEEMFNAAVDCISEALAKGEEITLRGFGTFKIVEQAARKGRNPQTGAEMMIPAKKKVKFSAAPLYEAKVNA